MTPIDRYQTAVHSHTTNSESPVTDLAGLIEWYSGGGRDEFINAFEDGTKLKLKGVNRTPRALIEQGFPSNINEYQKKTQWDHYYVANALIALQELDQLTKAYATPPPVDDLYHRNALALARKLLLDSLVLLEDWATYSQQLPGLVGIGKNRFESAMALVQSARQIIYGNWSEFSFTDNLSDTSINQLRMAIELRLRRGFGVVAKIDKSGSVVPLALSVLLDAIRPHKAHVKFAIALENIERLYGWANVYMHSGLKQYTWSPAYALKFLAPFLMGGKHSGGISASAGIQARRKSVSEIQAGVRARVDNKLYQVLINRPEECDLVLIA